MPTDIFNPTAAPSIGGTITGGTTGSILFINPTNTVAQDNPDFIYDPTNNTLKVRSDGTHNIQEWQDNSSVILASIDSTGNLTKIRSVAYSFPSSQGLASTILSNDGSGNLSWSSTTTLKLSKPLFDHFVDANNSGTSETDLYTDTLVAGQLSNNGEKLNIQYGGTFTGAAASTQQLKAYFGGTVIFDSGALSIGVATDSWDLQITVIRKSSSIVRCVASLTTNFASLSSYATYVEVTGLTLANTQVVKITGTAAGVGAVSNQITATEGYVEFKPAA